MQPPVTTVATDRFSDSLSSWHNPSFLAPLGHHVDRDGPAGLITGIATVQPSPQPQAYHPDHPLPSADGADAPVQRSVTAWPVPPAARSWLVSAPEVHHDPVPLAAVPAGLAAAGEERASTENASARDQEPEPPIAPADPPAAEADPPAGSTAPPLNPAGGAGEAAGGADEAAGGADEAKATAPTLQRGQLETSITPAHPHPADRGPAGSTVQLQSPQAPPQTPTRRLGLGAPLNDPPVRGVSVPSHRPDVSRPGPAALGEPVQGVPPGTARLAWGSGAEPGPPAAAPERPPGPASGWPPGPAEAAESVQRDMASPIGPGPGDQAVQRAEAPPARASLPGGPLAGVPPAGPPLPEAPLAGPLPPGGPLAGVPPAEAPLPEAPLAELSQTEGPLAEIPPAEASLAQAPLLGELPLVTRSGKPALAEPEPPAAQRATAIPGGSPPASAAPPGVATAPASAVPPGPATAPAPAGTAAHIQRLAGPPAGPGSSTMGRRSPDPAVAPWQPAGPKPEPGSASPDVRQAEPPYRAPAVQRISLPVRSSVSAGTLPLPRDAAVAPLLGQRQQGPGQWQQVSSQWQQVSGQWQQGPMQWQPTPSRWQPIRESGPPSDALPGPVSVQAAVRSAAPARPGVVPGPAPAMVQRSAADRPVARWPGGLATGLAAGPAAARRELPPGLPDAGAVAVAQGLAHRDPDGSVVFNLRPSLLLSDPATPPPPADGQPGGASGPQATVQRQEAAGPADSPATPADGALPPADSTPSPPTPAGQAAPAAAGPASPPLDELARQLFGPLAARLKSELRLDRERAGLLTDLRR